MPLAINNMKVGVVMPCKTPLVYARPAVESILAQTHRDMVFVIIADGCEAEVNGYLDGLKDPRVRLIKHSTPQGVARSLNAGLRLLDTEIVFRMDADDIAAPDRVAKQLEHMRRHPDLVAVGTNVRSFTGQPGEKTRVSHHPPEHAEIAYRLIWSNALAHPTVAFRREVVMAEGGYDESTVYAEDYALWSLLAPRWRLGNVIEPLLLYRTHGTQESIRYSAERRAIHARYAGRYREALTGIKPSPLFDHPADWTQGDSPSLAEWEQWLAFMERLAQVFLSGRIGRVEAAPFNPKKPMARRLWRAMKAARRLGTQCPSEAGKLLKQLAPFYALSKGVV